MQVTTADLRQRLADALAHSGADTSDFDLNANIALPPDRVLTPAAVLVAVRPHTGTVVLTRRSARLRHHPGQIAFPGGRQDPGDPSLIDTALREAREEVGIDTQAVDVLGTLPPHETVTGFEMTPVLAILGGAFKPAPEMGEVSEVFEVPLEHVLNLARYRVEARMWRGQLRRYYAVPFGPYYIWGATARVLRGLAERMR